MKSYWLNTTENNHSSPQLTEKGNGERGRDAYGVKWKQTARTKLQEISRPPGKGVKPEAAQGMRGVIPQSGNWQWFQEQGNDTTSPTNRGIDFLSPGEGSHD